MNKKNILVALVLILIIGGGLFLFLRKTPTGEGGPVSNINPFGFSSEQNVERAMPQPTDMSGGPIVLATNESGAVIKKITATPVAGFTFLGTGTSTSLRYVEKGTGRINDIGLINPAEVPVRVSTDTQSRVVLAYFLSQGKVVIRFKENDNGTLTAVFSSLASTSSSPSKNIPGTILAFDTTAAGDKAVFVLQDGVGSMITTANGDGSGAKVLWKSTLQDFVPQGLTKTVAVQTKASRTSSGSVFLLSGGVPQLYLSGASGFRANISPDTNWAVFSDYENTNSPLQIFDKNKNQRWDIFLATLPEKCAWSKVRSEIFYCFEFKGEFLNLPDDWYKGKVFLNASRLWKISAKTIQGIVLADMSSLTEAIDPTNLSLSGGDRLLGFINKHDSSLWLVDLTGVRPLF